MSHLTEVTKDTFISISQQCGSPQGFGSSVPETGMKTKYMFLVMKDNITAPYAEEG